MVYGEGFRGFEACKRGAQTLSFRRVWLVKGQYVRYPRALAILNDAGIPIKSLGAFPRIELLDVIKNRHAKHKDVTVDLDTDMVLPSEVNWKDVPISIPYNPIGKIYEIILRDYESSSAADF